MAVLVSVPVYMLAVVGLPLLVVGATLFVSVMGAPLPTMPTLPGGSKAAEATAPPGDDPAGPAPDDPSAAPVAAAGPSDPNVTRLEGVGVAVLGLLLVGGGALLATRRRYLVLLRGGNAMMQLPARDANEQMIILSTIQAIQSANKAAGPAPSSPAPAAPKPVEVDDGGDPVKALQELAAARSAGKVKEEEFQARREVLLARVAKGS